MVQREGLDPQDTMWEILSDLEDKVLAKDGGDDITQQLTGINDELDPNAEASFILEKEQQMKINSPEAFTRTSRRRIQVERWFQNYQI